MVVGALHAARTVNGVTETSAYSVDGELVSIAGAADPYTLNTFATASINPPMPVMSSFGSA